MNDNTVLIDLLQALLKQLQTSNPEKQLQTPDPKTQLQTPDPKKLFQAINKEDLAEIRSLIAAGVDVNHKNANGMIALYIAIGLDIASSTEMAHLLLDAGADVNLGYHDETPLMRACINGNLALVLLLLQFKANINLKDGKGNTALMHASQRGHLSIVKLLIKSGANVNQKNENGQTALTMAFDNGRKDVANVLWQCVDFYPRDNSSC